MIPCAPHSDPRGDPHSGNVRSLPTSEKYHRYLIPALMYCVLLAPPPRPRLQRPLVYLGLLPHRARSAATDGASRAPSARLAASRREFSGHLHRRARAGQLGGRDRSVNPRLAAVPTSGRLVAAAISQPNKQTQAALMQVLSWAHVAGDLRNSLPTGFGVWHLCG